MEYREINRIILRNIRNTINGLNELKDEAGVELQLHFDKVIEFCYKRIEEIEGDK